MADAGDMTALLLAWSDGEQAAGNRLIDMCTTNCGGWPSDVFGGSARIVRSHQPRWFTKRM